MQSHSPNNLSPVVRMKRLSHFRIDSSQLLVEFLVAPRGRPIQFHFHPLWPRHIIHFVHPLPVLVYQNLPEYRLYVIVGPTDDDREFSPREQIVDLDRPKKKKRNVRGRVKAGACNVHRKSVAEGPWNATTISWYPSSSCHIYRPASFEHLHFTKRFLFSLSPFLFSGNEKRKNRETSGWLTTTNGWIRF